MATTRAKKTKRLNQAPEGGETFEVGNPNYTSHGKTVEHPPILEAHHHLSTQHLQCTQFNGNNFCVTCGERAPYEVEDEEIEAD